MRKIFIILLIIFCANFGIKIPPSMAMVDYIFETNTKGRSTIPIKNIPDNSGVITYQIKNNERVFSCSQCDEFPMFYDSEGNIWWEIRYEDRISNKIVYGYIEDQYLLFIDGGGCINGTQKLIQTPSACFGK